MPEKLVGTLLDLSYAREEKIEQCKLISKISVRYCPIILKDLIRVVSRAELFGSDSGLKLTKILGLLRA